MTACSGPRRAQLRKEKASLFSQNMAGASARASPPQARIAATASGLCFGDACLRGEFQLCGEPALGSLRGGGSQPECNRAPVPAIIRATPVRRGPLSRAARVRRLFTLLLPKWPLTHETTNLAPARNKRMIARLRAGVSFGRPPAAARIVRGQARIWIRQQLRGGVPDRKER